LQELVGLPTEKRDSAADLEFVFSLRGRAVYNISPTKDLVDDTMTTDLRFVFYFAVKPEKRLFSPESNRIIFAGADFEADLKLGGSMDRIGKGPDGKPAISW